MKDLETLKAEHAKQVARLQAELDIAAQMPFAPDSVQLSGAADRAPWVTYRKRQFSDAIELFKGFHVIPVYVQKGTFTEICPNGMARADSHIERGPFAIWMTVDHNAAGSYGPLATLHFFARVNGKPYRVNIDIEGPGYIGACHVFAPAPIEERDRNGRLIARSYGGNQALNGLADYSINWSYGGGGRIAEGSRRDYLICADDEAEAPGADHSHACGQLANIADLLTGARP